MGPEFLVRAVSDLWPTAPPAVLEPAEGTSQCSYELVRAFAAYAKARGVRYTLGAGTLLGAMRNQPGGLLRWEHDVDVYVPARDASRLIDRLHADCAARHQSRWCKVLDFPGLVDRRGGGPCCGFGFKIFHRHSEACELDVLVLAATRAPFMHGETRLWPPWGLVLSSLYHSIATSWLAGSDDGEPHFVIPEDVTHKSLMGDMSRWCPLAPVESAKASDEWAWCGAPLSFFQDEYFAPGEYFPLSQRRFHGMLVTVPQSPWAVLNRTYGADCAYIARLNEHGGARADLRLPKHKALLSPAPVRTLPWWRETWLAAA